MSRRRFAVEFRAQWASSRTAFLTPDLVDALFAPWGDTALTMRSWGVLNQTYVAHADPSICGANSGLVIAHRDGPDTHGQYHVVVDLIHAWRPADFPEGRIDYYEVQGELETLIRAFPMSQFTTDQMGSAGPLDALRRYAQRSRDLIRRPQVFVRPETRVLNLVRAETFRDALTRRLVHAPHHCLAEQELRFLEVRNGRVDHPTAGPVQTSDVATCLMAVTQELIGDGAGGFIAEELGGLSPRGIPADWAQPSSPVHQALSQLRPPVYGQRRAPFNPARGRAPRPRRNY